MSDRTNVDVVQRVYEALGREDIPALLELLTDDVEWVYQGPSVIPFAGTRYGREGVVEFFTLLGETLEFEHFEPREFVAQDNRVVVIGFERNLIKPTGRTFEQEWVHDYTLRDGKISKVRSFEDTAAYVAALGTTRLRPGLFTQPRGRSVLRSSWTAVRRRTRRRDGYLL